ncbi:MAG: hypothetical protein LBE31_01275 [Deltaproteobacteria bacterium]|jgi:hypothetical protein|nr:hypothetical protein [Deltaproteobacteria bacterium]
MNYLRALHGAIGLAIFGLTIIILYKFFQIAVRRAKTKDTPGILANIDIDKLDNQYKIPLMLRAFFIGSIFAVALGIYLLYNPI